MLIGTNDPRAVELLFSFDINIGSLLAHAAHLHVDLAVTRSRRTAVQIDSRLIGNLDRTARLIGRIVRT